MPPSAPDDPLLRRSFCTSIRPKSSGAASTIRDEFPRAVVQVILYERSNSIADTAMLPGRAEPSAVYHAFFNWSGQIPGAFRDAERQAACTS